MDPVQTINRTGKGVSLTTLLKPGRQTSQICHTGESGEPILRSVMLRLNVCDYYTTMYLAARHGSYLGTPWTLPLLSLEHARLPLLFMGS